MRFTDLVAEYGRLDATSRRLEMRSILSTLFRHVSPQELPQVVYLSLGQVRPEYEGIELGVADSLALDAVARALDRPASEVARHVKRSGDLGTTTEEFVAEGSRTPIQPPLSVEDVFSTFLQISRAAGEGSQERKVAELSSIIQRASPAEAKYIVRFALGKLRLGVREMTIMDALSDSYAEGSKDARTRIEAAFNLSSDLGDVAQRLATKGLAGLEGIELQVGRPIRAMLAERARDLDELLERMAGRAALEYKYDGLRIQAHVPEKGPVRLFSRRLEELSRQFPELVDDLPRAIRTRPAIVEGECVPVDPDTDEIRPFQDVSRRRGRKYDLERIQLEIPVRFFVFDLLLVGELPLIDRDFPERRRLLESSLTETERVRLARQKVVTTVKEAQSFFDQAIADGCEGIMAKSVGLGSSYRAGARGFWWIKYKRDYTHALADSIDGVIVGAFYGRGRRAGRYGALLCAAFNPKEDRFETFCKVGSGFDDPTLAELPKLLAPYEIPERSPDVLTELTADRWMRPALVIEIRGAELTLSPNHRAAVGRLRADAGLALRFPRFTGRFREDKEADQATTTDELVRMYESQVKQATSGESRAGAAASPG